VPDHETLAAVRRWTDAFNAHDPALLDNILAEHCILEDSTPPPDGSRYAGREECRQFWSSLAQDQQRTFDMEDIWVDGERAVARWRHRWGPGWQDQVRGVNLIRVRDGRIVEVLGYVKG
jgi:ketosteroid isomerase-like protein